jgi:hypothetical protein
MDQNRLGATKKLEELNKATMANKQTAQSTTDEAAPGIGSEILKA